VKHQKVGVGKKGKLINIKNLKTRVGSRGGPNPLGKEIPRGSQKTIKGGKGCSRKKKFSQKAVTGKFFPT